MEKLAEVRIPGTTTDLSGLSGMLETNTPIDALGGFSALDYTGQGNRYVVLSDRGAGDGAASFPCRYHEFDLKWDAASRSLSFQLVATHRLSNAQGQPLTGSLESLKPWRGSERPTSYDPEGIRWLGEGRVLISDEYGPFIDTFDRNGNLQSSVTVPDAFGLSDRREPPLVFGTFPNRGLEGIAVTPGNKTIVAAMQGPLVQDGRIENNKCYGLWTRWLVLPNAADKEVPSRQVIYPLDHVSTGVSEVLAIDEHRFLVLERDSNAGIEAKFKNIYLADLRDASDVSSVSSLRDGLPAGTRPAAKRLLIDLLAPAFGLSGEKAPEKPEGLAWGPRLADGRRLLMVCFDNDFDPARESIFVAFAIAGLDR
ncbi:MAG: esterase-like activity of phytase family protein [Pirellula sp.]